MLQLVNCCEKNSTLPSSSWSVSFASPLQVAIVFRIEGRELLRSLESGDGFRHRVIGGVRVVHHAGAVEKREGASVVGVLHEPRDDARLVRHLHLDRVELRIARLPFEIGSPAVEELASHILPVVRLVERRAEARVHRGRRVAVAERDAVITERDGAADRTFARIGEGEIGRVAGGARHGAVEREIGVVEERLAELLGTVESRLMLCDRLRELRCNRQHGAEHERADRCRCGERTHRSLLLSQSPARRPADRRLLIQ